MKLAIYGTGEVAETFCAMLDKRNENAEIIYFIQTEKTTDLFLGKKVISLKEIRYSDFDYLVIASNVYYQEIITCLKSFDNGYEQYKSKIKKYDEWLPVKWEVIKSVMPYQSCKVCEDIVYVALSEDETIPRYMYETGRNFSDIMIDTFFRLADKYFPDLVKSGGYFLDIGANIGTTSIYVKKKINRNLQIVGFEPYKSNYDLFRVNCILNQAEDIRTECIGLSNVKIRNSNFALV